MAKKRNILKKYHFEIRGEAWTARYLSESYFDKIHKDEEAAAICWKDKKIIDFKKLTFKIVKHELFHAYFSTLCLDDADVRISEVEEILANFMEKHLENYLFKSKEVWRSLK